MNDKKLKDLRKNAKLSQQNLADLVGVDRRSIINYEKGEKIPEPIVKLLHILLETDYLQRLESNEISYIKINEVENGNENSVENLISELKSEFLGKIDSLSDQMRANNIINKTYLKSIINHF
ncbi:helix-turn-helix transcriptional regulator, partial [Chryseobacterium arthrosphaerae]